MILSLSERKTTALIQQLEGTDETMTEITYNFKRYGTRLFQHVAQAFALEYAGMTSLSGDIADFRFIIHCGRDISTNDFNWDLFLGGLSFLGPIGVTIERDDIFRICDGLIGKALHSEWANIRQNFERLSVGEVRETIEAWCAHLGFNGGADQTIVQMGVDAAFEEVGINDPLKLQKEIDEYRRAEEQAVREAGGNTSSGFRVRLPDGSCV